MKSNNDMKDLTKEKIIEMCPDVAGSSKTYGLPYTITLAVVLRAIETTKHLVTFQLKGFGNFKIIADVENTENSYAKGMDWDLKKDYDQQSEECKKFIGTLLGVK